MKKKFATILITVALVGGVNLGLVKAEPFQFSSGISTETVAENIPSEETLTPIATLIQAPTPVRTEVIPIKTPEPWIPPDLASYKDLLEFCGQSQVDSTLWRYRLNQLTFMSDVSANAQEQLSDDVRIVPSCNFALENEPRAIVLHYTEGSLEATISTFQQPHNSSAHYVIDRDGKVYQLIPERFAAFHVTCYGNRDLCIPSCPICSDKSGNFVEPRTQSIGIELVNQGHIDPRYFKGEIYEDYSNAFGYRFWEDYSMAQIESLKILAEDVATRWGIPNSMILGHSRINNNVDPGPALNLFWPRYGFPIRAPIFSPIYFTPKRLPDVHEIFQN